MSEPWLYVSTGLQVGSGPTPPGAQLLVGGFENASGQLTEQEGSTCLTATVTAQWGEGSTLWLGRNNGLAPSVDCSMWCHVFPHTHTEGVRNLAVSLNRPGLFSICRENLSMWEKIACGEVEDIVPSPPYDSGPVKVDNWLPKSLLARQRNTTCILPRTSYSVRGRTHIPCCRDTEQLRATWLWKLSYLIGWRRCRHWWFHQPQRRIECQQGDLNPSPYIHTAWEFI